MNTARKLSLETNPSHLYAVRETFTNDFVNGLQLLGWSNLPLSAVKSLEEDIRVFLDDLISKSSSADSSIAKRRSKVVFWVNAYLRGDCSLSWLLEMLDRLPSSKKEA